MNQRLSLSSNFYFGFLKVENKKFEVQSKSDLINYLTAGHPQIILRTNS